MIDFQENIAVLHSIIDGIPERLIDLCLYKQKSHCGTICCGAGWATMHPYFQAQGIMLDEWNLPTLAYRESTRVDEALDTLFGDNAFSTMFERRSEGDWDGELLTKGMTDKELLLARLKKGYHQHAPKHND